MPKEIADNARRVLLDDCADERHGACTGQLGSSLICTCGCHEEDHRLSFDTHEIAGNAELVDSIAGDVLLRHWPTRSNNMQGFCTPCWKWMKDADYRMHLVAELRKAGVLRV